MNPTSTDVPRPTMVVNPIARRLAVAGLGGVLVLAHGVLPSAAQQTPMAPIRDAGQSVTPVFEGWYRNPDGTFSLSFGYYNRNAKEVVEVSIGPNKFNSPGEQNQGQPTEFVPRRNWGVFAVNVPAGFGGKKVTWTLTVRGETFAIPGWLHKSWEIDALEGEAGSGNTPPVLKFDPAGIEGRGPAGITSPPLVATVGQPLTLTVWANDDGRARSSVASAGRGGVPVSLAWFKHQGPGPVEFSTRTPTPGRPDGTATTTATFRMAGAYVLRVRANDASGVASAGHAQCCWTNGFVNVTVR